MQGKNERKEKCITEGKAGKEENGVKDGIKGRKEEAKAIKENIEE
jgi:hypothetical protein